MITPSNAINLSRQRDNILISWDRNKVAAWCNISTSWGTSRNDKEIGMVFKLAIFFCSMPTDFIDHTYKRVKDFLQDLILLFSLKVAQVKLRLSINLDISSYIKSF